MSIWKRPQKVRPTRLTKDDLIDIGNIYQYYFKNHQFKGGNPELWFTVILDFLGWRNWDVIRPELQELEDRILEMELTETYVGKLMATFSPTAEISEADKIYMLITMGSEIRKQMAIEVLGLLETR